jgi:hypothetical protein
MKTLGKVATAVLLVFLMAIVTGWGVSTMWTWFIGPLGVRPIGFSHACGIMTLARVMVHAWNHGKKADANGDGFAGAARRSVGEMIAVVATVGIGWIFHSFM